MQIPDERSMRRPLARSTVLLALLLVGSTTVRAQGGVPVLEGVPKSAVVRIGDDVLSRRVALAAKSDGSKVEDVWVPLADFATAMNGTSVLEPTLQLHGSTLVFSAASTSGRMEDRPVRAQHKPIKINSNGKTERKGIVETKGSTKTQGDFNARRPPDETKGWTKTHGDFHAVRSPGVISTSVRMLGGEAYVPLVDIARAFFGAATAENGAYQITIRR